MMGKVAAVLKDIVVAVANMVHSKASMVTTHKHAAFKLAASETSCDAFSKHDMNIALATAAAMVHISPEFKERIWTPTSVLIVG
jgi:hypothetical protein